MNPSVFMFRSSSRGDALVDGYNGPVIATGGVGCQKGHHVCHIIHLHRSTQRCVALDQLGVETFRGPHVRRDIGHHTARRHRVDAQRPVHVLHGQRLGQAVDGSLGGAVGAHIRFADKGAGGRHVDDGAVVFQQMGNGGLHQPEWRGEVDRERTLEILGRHLVGVAHHDDAGHVAQGIEAAESLHSSVTAARQASRTVRSATWVTTRTPLSARLSAVSCSPSALTSTRYTSAPACASRRAQARPSPEAAPVTRAAFPFISLALIINVLSLRSIVLVTISRYELSLWLMLRTAALRPPVCPFRTPRPASPTPSASRRAGHTAARIPALPRRWRCRSPSPRKYGCGSAWTTPSRPPRPG